MINPDVDKIKIQQVVGYMIFNYYVYHIRRSSDTSCIVYIINFGLANRRDCLFYWIGKTKDFYIMVYMYKFECIWLANSSRTLAGHVETYVCCASSIWIPLFSFLYYVLFLLKKYPYMPTKPVKENYHYKCQNVYWKI